jgi:RNA polymerase sigma-70 factor (ECF subfamily)
VAFPPPAAELALHERVLAGDPIAPADTFEVFMDPLVLALCSDLSCGEDDAHDGAIDALFAYLDDASRYDRGRGRLSTYLMNIAKKRVIDRLRSRRSAGRREGAFAEAVVLRLPDPKERMETDVEGRQLWQKVAEEVPDERDRRVLELVLAGERSTDVLAQALGLSGLAPDDQRRAVKQNRDRLMKVLERLGRRLGHDDNS